MNHVAQRLEVHQPVLDTDPEDKAVLGVWLWASGKIGFPQALIDFISGLPAVLADGIHARPVGGYVTGKISVDRIDTEREQMIELGMSGFETKRTSADHVPVESVEMSKIKDDAVPGFDRPVIHRLRIDQLEHVVGLLPGVIERSEERRVGK